MERCEVVVEYKCARICRIMHSTGARIPWAKIAVRIMRRPFDRMVILDLPLPRPFAAMRRNEHPLAGEHILAAMWGACECAHAPYSGTYTVAHLALMLYVLSLWGASALPQ